MVKSMTGYGRAEDVIDGMQIAVEMKSVNHRYLEFSAKVPRSYGFLEDRLKRFVQPLISRGKVDCFVQIDTLEDADVTVQVNHSLADGYVAALRELMERYGLRDDISASALGRYSDVFSIHKAEADEEKSGALCARWPSALWTPVYPCVSRRAPGCGLISFLGWIPFSIALHSLSSVRRKPCVPIAKSSMPKCRRCWRMRRWTSSGF